MRAGHISGVGGVLLAALVGALLTASCRDSGATDTAMATTAAPPVTARTVAAVEVVTGDCLSGLVLGERERIRIDSVRVVACESAHDLEVFATVQLGDQDFPNTPPGEYPGQERVVDVADSRCAAELDRLAVGDAPYGLIALWPTIQSWQAGDRSVACAVYGSDGRRFEGRQLLSSP